MRKYFLDSSDEIITGEINLAKTEDYRLPLDEDFRIRLIPGLKNDNREIPRSEIISLRIRE